MSKIESVSFIGSGNVATHLAKALNNAEIKVQSVFSRNMKNAKKLADLVHAKGISNMENIALDSDLYIFAVNDSIVRELAKKLKLVAGQNVMVAHTSGMLSSEVFSEYFNNYGVFYPLQTFKKSREVNIKEVPFLITANGSKQADTLFDLASMISDNVHFIDDKKRKALHVAAVFANNFTNYMYSLADDILENEDINFDLLRPLIKETAMKIYEGQKPAEVQTGPAVRGDTDTIKAHLSFLKNNKTAKQIYKLLTGNLSSIK